MANTIDSARAAGIKWVIVGMHKVCISMGIAPCDIGNDLLNLLVSKKVDLILQAHDHDYQRSKQLALNGPTCTAIQVGTYNSNCVVNDGSTGSYTQGSGPVVVIVGTAGEGLHTLNLCDGDTGYFAKWMGNNVNPTNGLTKFTISADQLTASANFIGSTAPNNFTDSFTITSSTAPQAIRSLLQQVGSLCFVKIILHLSRQPVMCTSQAQQNQQATRGVSGRQGRHRAALPATLGWIPPILWMQVMPNPTHQPVVLIIPG